MYYRKIPNTEKPSILEVAIRYTPLRRVGKEYVGICPLHRERNASFYVNAEKGFFFCHACRKGGDVIRLIEHVEQLDFKSALAHLGLNREKPRVEAAVIRKRRALKEAVQILSQWVSRIVDCINSRMREIGEQLSLASELLTLVRAHKIRNASVDNEFLIGEVERLSREWDLLEVFAEDCFNPEYILPLWFNREVFESIRGPVELEQRSFRVPPITNEYKEQLALYYRT